MAALIVLTDAAFAVAGVLFPALLTTFEWLLKMSGFVAKLVAGAGMVVIVAATIVAIVIAFPTLQEIGQDLQNDLRKNYRDYRRAKRLEDGSYPF